MKGCESYEDMDKIISIVLAGYIIGVIILLLNK